MKRISLFISLILSIITMTAWANNALEAHDPWVREAPPTVEVLAAYMTLHNHSDKTQTVLSITSDNFDRVEIHRTEIHNDMAQMVPVSKVMISPNGKVTFAPGGLHIMLIGPKKIIKEGENVQLTLHLSDNSLLNINAPVKKSNGMEDHSMHDIHHDMKHESMPENDDDQLHEHTDHHH